MPKELLEAKKLELIQEKVCQSMCRPQDDADNCRSKPKRPQKKPKDVKRPKNLESVMSTPLDNENVLTAVVAGASAGEAVALTRADRDQDHLHRIVEIQGLPRDEEETLLPETLRRVGTEIRIFPKVEAVEKGEVVDGQVMVVRGQIQGLRRAETIVDTEGEPGQAEEDPGEASHQPGHAPDQHLDPGHHRGRDQGLHNHHDGEEQRVGFQDLPRPAEADRLRQEENEGDPDRGPGLQALPAEVLAEAEVETGIDTGTEGDADQCHAIS